MINKRIGRYKCKRDIKHANDKFTATFAICGEEHAKNGKYLTIVIVVVVVIIIIIIIVLHSLYHEVEEKAKVRPRIEYENCS